MYSKHNTFFLFTVSKFEFLSQGLPLRQLLILWKTYFPLTYQFKDCQSYWFQIRNEMNSKVFHFGSEFDNRD